MPRMGKVILAAALRLVGCVLSIAAGLPPRCINFMSAGRCFFIAANGVEDTIGSVENGLGDEDYTPIDPRGRQASGSSTASERTDLHRLIDENTPYIYEHTDPHRQQGRYSLWAGTVDHFGWASSCGTESGTGSLPGPRLRDT